MLMAAAWQDAGQSVSLDDRDPQLSATNAAGIFRIPWARAQYRHWDTAPTIGQPATFEASEPRILVRIGQHPSPLDLATPRHRQRIKAERTGPTRRFLTSSQTNNRFFNDMPERPRKSPSPP